MSASTMAPDSESSAPKRFPTPLWICASTLFVLLLTAQQLHQGQALPLSTYSDNNGRVFFAAVLRDADGRSSLVPMNGAPMFRLLAPPAEQNKKRRDLAALSAGGYRQPLLAKKYDRNCFFSPVQCTLQQWNDGNPADEVLLGGGAGRRRRR